MSRSWKKAHGYSDNSHGNNVAKKYAYRKARYAKIISNGGKYKKLYEQWRIRDYNFRWYSRKEYLRYCAKNGKSMRYFHKGCSK
jgi:hypothetical protein